MRFLSIFLLLLVFATNALPQKPLSKWKVSDYLENLPEEYKLFGNQGPPTKNTTIIDDKNGYAAFMSSEDEYAIPMLEMALFKPNKGESTIVVTNLEDDHVCMNNYSYFLQIKDNRWVDVKNQVLPKLDFSMIFINGKNDDSYKYYLEMQKKYGSKIPDLEYIFSPPRMGTKMKVDLVLCDWIDESVEENKDLMEYQMIADSFKPIYLQWNKTKGKFEFVKETE